MTDRKETDGGTSAPSPFETAGSYAYDLFLHGAGEGRMSWEVTELSDDDVAVAFDYELNSQGFETTVTGGTETVRDELLATPAYPFVTAVLFSSVLPILGVEELSIGDQFSIPVPEGEGTVEITGQYTHAGIEGYTSVWRVDGERRYEDCVAPDLDLLLSATYYPPGSTVAFLWLGLVTYEQPGDET